jgi:hypothetical protein
MLVKGLDSGCPACKRGTLILVGRAGRVVSLDGTLVAVPSNFMVQTCNECGAERWDAGIVSELKAAIEAARIFALRTAATAEMESFPDDDD